MTESKTCKNCQSYCPIENCKLRNYPAGHCLFSPPIANPDSGIGVFPLVSSEQPACGKFISKDTEDDRVMCARLEEFKIYLDKLSPPDEMGCRLLNSIVRKLLELGL